MNFRKITRPTTDMMQKLFASRNFISDLFLREKSDADALTELAASGEPGVLLQIAHYLLDPRRKVETSARRAIHTLLRAVHPADLIEFDVEIRDMRYNFCCVDPRWSQLAPKDLNNLKIGEFSISALGIASFHRRGQVREAAIKLLAEFNDGSELPYLLVRLNDWVESVQHVAWLEVKRRLVPEYAPHFLTNLLLIKQLVKCTRNDLSSFAIMVASLFQRTDCLIWLQKGVSSPEVFIRRTCLHYALGCPDELRKQIFRAALDEPDPFNRLWSARQLIATLSNAELTPLVTKLYCDPYMPIRREGLSALAERQPDAAQTFLIEALLDQHASVQEAARFYVRKIGNFDIAAFYRGDLNTKNRAKLLAVIAGLGETGNEDDALAIEPYLVADNARLRAAACRALAKLSPNRFFDRFIEMLTDKSPKVASIACSILMSKVSRLSSMVVTEMLNASQAPFVRRNALRLIRRMGKWERLPILLSACRDPDESVNQLARECVRMWFQNYNLSFAEPTTSQLYALEIALNQNGELLKPELADQFRKIIDEWRQHKR